MPKCSKNHDVPGASELKIFLLQKALKTILTNGSLDESISKTHYILQFIKSNILNLFLLFFLIVFVYTNVINITIDAILNNIYILNTDKSRDMSLGILHIGYNSLFDVCTLYNCFKFIWFS